MAGRTEVPDSEDEPMTSSPVNILDGAADKLSEATPVSLRDAQDSLHEAAQPHQANAENVAHPHAERTDGADRENASLDVEASRVDHTNIQPNIATSGENHTSQAHSGQVSPFPPNSSSHVEAQLVDTDMTSQPDVITTSTTPDTLQEAGQTTATEYVDTGTPATDMTSLAPGIKYSDKEMKMHDQPKSATQADLLGHAERSSDGVKPSASGPINIEQKSEESERVTVDSFISNNGKPENNPSAQPTKPDTSHNTPNTPMDSQSESASTVADLPTPAMNVPVVGSHHVTGDRAVQQMPEDGMSEAHVQNSDSGPVAEQAASPNESSSPGLQHGNGAMDVEMSDASPVDTEKPPAIKTTSFGSNEADAPVKNKTFESMDLGVTPTQNSVTESDAMQHPEPVSYAPETYSGAQEGSGHTEVEKSQAPADKVPITSATAGPIPSTTSATSPDADPKTSSQDAAANTDTQEPTIPKTPQEITLDDLKAQKDALLASLSTLPAIRVLMEENAMSDADGSAADDEPTEADIMAAANKIVKDHIKLLHEYNELKDVGQGLMGLIADARAVRIVEVQEEFGIEAKD